MHLDLVCVLGIIGVISETKAPKAMGAGRAFGGGHAGRVIARNISVDTSDDLHGAGEIDGTDGRAGKAGRRAARGVIERSNVLHTDLSRGGGVVGHAASRGVGSCL